MPCCHVSHISALHTHTQAHELLNDDGLLFVSMPNRDCVSWRRMDATSCNPYWGEIEPFHHFTRAGLHELLLRCGFTPIHYAVSQRYQACMEVVAVKIPAPTP